MKKIVFILLLFVLSCRGTLKQDHFKVYIPQVLHGYYEGRDTILHACENTPKTLLYYYPNSNCPSCDVGHTLVYRKYIDYALQNPDKLRVSFIYCVKDSAVVEDIRIYTIMYPINSVICVDWGGNILKENPKLPTNCSRIILLLDSKDSILLSDIYVKDEKSSKLFDKQLDDLVFNP